ncbi:hypothetical protein Tco_1465247 [Tanacetum coccineum]
MESQFQSLKEEMHEMRKNYNNRGGNQASKNDDTPMCERHEANYIQYVGYQNRDSHDPYSHQSLHDSNDSEKSLTELNNDVKNDLEDFKRCIRSMRTVHSKLYERDDQSKTDLEKIITKFLDGQRVANIKMDEWEKSQNVSLEKTDMTDPPPPQAHTEHVNAVFTGSGKSDDSPKIQKDPPPLIIGLAPEIKANVNSSKPATIQGVVSMANRLTTDGIKDGIFKKKENAKDKKSVSMLVNIQSVQSVTSITLATVLYGRCKQVGHFTRYCTSRVVNERPRPTCYECRDPNYLRKNYPRLNRATTSGGNRPNLVLTIEGNGNQGNKENQARGRAFVIGAAEAP